VDSDKQQAFRGRARKPTVLGGAVVSIKVRDDSYHFDRGHSPQAWRLIDAPVSKLSSTDADFSLEEHESGPELLVYLAAVTAGVTLAKSSLISSLLSSKRNPKGSGKATPHPHRWN
jgi:hypothetical protein